jgi:chorismate mutase
VSDDDLAGLRARIDRADRDLLSALGRRWAAVHDVRALKRAAGLAGHDPERERALRARWHAFGAREGLPESVIDAVFDAVISVSRAEVTREG